MRHIHIYSILLAFALLATILLPRVTDLNRFITADEPRWQANVAGFTIKLARADFRNLLQQPHPGITTQWFASPAIWQKTWAEKKLPLILAQCVLLLFAAYLMGLLWGKKTGILGAFILALNPFLIAHTRVYAMDSLLAIFLLISLLALLVWNKTQENRYLLYAGSAGALAFLSKLPGSIIVPFSIIIIFFLTKNSKTSIQSCFIWIISFVVTSVIVLPSFLIRPIGIFQDLAGFLSSDDYTSLHQYGLFYYLGTLVFLTTLIQISALVATIIKPSILKHKQDVAILMLFAVAFILMMTIGAKKGDRYILPAFLMFDTCTAYVASRVLKKRHTWAILLLICAFLFQAIHIVKLHPYELAYVNPLTGQFLGDRQLGWGEGLDIAAQYINAKPDAKEIQVATYYASQFESLFIGKTVPLHQWDSASNDYAILYRAMYGRSEDSWETDVLQHFTTKKPEKIISLNGIEYIWIYKLEK
ncbi:MAG: glycosyltransferase family 39 protein [bacterium]|nr:glycosyltransferase family 39 protein [bacterium]